MRQEESECEVARLVLLGYRHNGRTDQTACSMQARKRYSRTRLKFFFLGGLLRPQMEDVGSFREYRLEDGAFGIIGSCSTRSNDVGISFQK